METNRLERVLAGVAAIACLGAVASADELELRGGGRLRGIIVERTATTITIETGPGRVTLPLTRVMRVVDGRSSLEAWRERSARLSPTDAAGWAALARWAADNDLLTQARLAWERVLALDPGNAEANTALGNVRRDDGRWAEPAPPQPEPPVTGPHPSAAEAAARVREAEARAREAEARARAAEAAATDPSRSDSGDSEGIPLWWAYGVPTVGPALVPRPDPHEHSGPCCASRPAPPQPVRPSSIGPTTQPSVPKPAPVRARPSPVDPHGTDRSERSSVR